MNENKIVILTDSSTHIPESIRKGLNISVIPVWLHWDNDRFRDGVDIDWPLSGSGHSVSLFLVLSEEKSTPGGWFPHEKSYNMGKNLQVSSLILHPKYYTITSSDLITVEQRNHNGNSEQRYRSHRYN